MRCGVKILFEGATDASSLEEPPPKRAKRMDAECHKPAATAGEVSDAEAMLAMAEFADMF